MTGLGLHLVIDMVKDCPAKERAVDGAEINLFKCLFRGLSVKAIVGNVLTLSPAPVITRMR